MCNYNLSIKIIIILKIVFKNSFNFPQNKILFWLYLEIFFNINFSYIDNYRVKLK